MATMKLNCNSALIELLAERKRLRDRELEIADDRKIVEERVMAALEGHINTLIEEIDQGEKSLTSSIKLYNIDGELLADITGIGYGLKVNQVLASQFVEKYPHALNTLLKREFKPVAKGILEQLAESAPESAMKADLSGVVTYTYSTPRLSVK